MSHKLNYIAKFMTTQGKYGRPTRPGCMQVWRPSDGCSLSSDLSVSFSCPDCLVLAEQKVQGSQYRLEIAFDNIYRGGREGKG